MNMCGRTSVPWTSLSPPDSGSQGPRQRRQPSCSGHLGREPESSRREGMEEGWGDRGAGDAGEPWPLWAGPQQVGSRMLTTAPLSQGLLQEAIITAPS